MVLCYVQMSEMRSEQARKMLESLKKDNQAILDKIEFQKQRQGIVDAYHNQIVVFFATISEFSFVCIHRSTLLHW